MSVYVYVPFPSPLTVWLPFGAVLLMPLPVTETDVAFDVFHETVIVPGAPALVGLAEIDPDTDDGAVTVTVADCVAGPFGPWAVTV